MTAHPSTYKLYTQFTRLSYDKAKITNQSYHHRICKRKADIIVKGKIKKKLYSEEMLCVTHRRSHSTEKSEVIAC